MLLAEEFLLLALDPVAGRPPLGTGDNLKPGLCGALLAELVLSEKVAVVGDRVQVTDTGPTGDDMLDEVLRLLAADGRGPRKLKGQLKTIARGVGNVRDRVAGRLVSTAVLDEERSRFVGIVPVTRYRVRDLESRQRVPEDLRRWLADPTSPVEGRLATLVALLEACHLLGMITENRTELRTASPKARAAMADTPAAMAVRAVIDEVRTPTAAGAAALFG